MPLQIIRQDIIRMEVDAIVNTTNPEMVGYSGVDYAIHAAAGEELDKFCESIAPVRKGTAVVTPGFNLPCRYIIHTCGPVWNGGDNGEIEQLKNCYLTCLDAALEKECETIAFPLISSGNYGFPKDKVLGLAVKSISDFLIGHEMTVYLCVFDKKSYELSKNLIADVQSFINDNYVDINKPTLCNRPTPSRSEIAGVRLGRARMSRPVHDDYAFEMAPDRLPEISDDSKSSLSFSEELSLENLIENMDKSFSETLFELIDKKGMSDVECYKKANVTRKTFSKIRCDSDYHPSKETAVAFAIALELSLSETNAFLRTAGFTLSHCFRFDIIIEYFISKGIYDLQQINETLFHFDQTTLGC